MDKEDVLFGDENDVGEEEMPRASGITPTAESSVFEVGLFADEEEDPQEAGESQQEDDQDLFGLGGDDDDAEEDEELRRTTDDGEKQMGRAAASEATQSAVIVRRPQPQSDHQFLTLRIPSSFRIEQEPWVRSKAKRHYHRAYRQKAAKPGDLENSEHLKLNPRSIRWRFARDSDGKLIRDEHGTPKQESNTRLLRWSDGSFTLAIGEDQLDCQMARDKSYIFEDSNPNFMLMHTFVNHRMVCRPFNHHWSSPSAAPGDSLSAKPHQHRSTPLHGPRTKLTTASEATKTGKERQQKWQDANDRSMLKSSQKAASTTQQGLTARYLEGSADDDDDIEDDDALSGSDGGGDSDVSSSSASSDSPSDAGRRGPSSRGTAKGGQSSTHRKDHLSQARPSYR